jgi:hypothetical protein
MVPQLLNHLGDNMPTTTMPNEERKVIGYTLEPIYETPRGYVVTQAFILCTSCGGAISGTGGPRYNSVCLKCIEQLDLINKLKA